MRVVHSRTLRRGLPLGGGKGDPNSDSGPQRQRLRGTGPRDRPGGVHRLDHDPRSAASRSDAPDVCRALQQRAARSRSRPCDTCGERRGPDYCGPARRSPTGSARRPDPRVPWPRRVIESGFPTPTGPLSGHRPGADACSLRVAIRIRRLLMPAAEQRGSGNNEEGEGNKWLALHPHTC